MFLSGAALAAFGVWALRAAKHPLREVPVARYSGPMSGELIEDLSPLKQVLPEVNLDSMTLGEAIEALRRASGANIFVNWRRLSQGGPPDGPGTRLTMELRLKNVTLGQALAKVLACCPSVAKLGCGMKDGIITVSDEWPPSVSERTSVARWYYVQDLLNYPAHYGFNRPGRFDNRDQSTRPAPAVSVDDAPLTRQEIEEELVRIITEQVDVESWRDNGGADGSIRSWAGRLIIQQTPENHQKIESLLANLRKGP
jgi:hypothetical protein